MIRPNTFHIVLVFIFLIRFNAFPQAFSDIEWYDVDSLQSVLPGLTGEARMHTLNALAASLSFEDKEECRKYALAAMELAKDLESNEGVAAASRNLARMEFYDGNYPSALDFYHKALQIYEEEGNRYLVAQLLEDIATTHFFARNYVKTFELIKEALAVYRSRDENGETVGDVRDTMSIYSRAGLPYRNTGHSDTKNSYYRYDSLKYTVSWGSEFYLPFTKKLIREATYEQAIQLYDLMYKLNLERGHLKTAMEYLISCSDAKDTLRKLMANRESVEIQTRYETERKNAEILSLSRQNELSALQLSQTRLVVVGLGSLLLLIVFLTIILVRQYRLKNSQQNLLLQQRLLRTQMNPHFLFNSLASIQNYIIKEKPAMASDYLCRFSKLVRQILNNSAEEWVPLEDELESIENYLEMEHVRHRGLFDFSVDVDEALDPETVLVPPMLAQPFIENSIEHGVKQKEGKGHMKITFTLNGKLIRFELEDDGIGRDKAMQILKSQNRDHRSMSTDITRDRLHVLSKKTRQKINLSIIDLYDEKGEAIGTRVVFDMPFKN